MSRMSRSIALVTALSFSGAAAFWVTTAQAEKPSPAALTAPPPVAKESLYQSNRVTSALPGTPNEVRAFFDANPIVDFLTPTDAIPAITGITYLTGDWPEVGAQRRVNLDGGYSVLERVLVNTPSQFTYQIWEITAPAGRFIDHIKGEFRYLDQTDGGTEVVWDYNVKPAAFFARPFIRQYLDNDFGPFMAAGMTGISEAYRTR
ncbi:hypothetical protein [Sulfitobacter aestuariivivens]|uniref:SRPBCC family protein n=1 Tax=Sulfitobacter aestuariivivens TaxID=2766981 RepID=A0A927HEX5_9RHOB|nr:hypothetical protein [Sulfitobacter aestuariivivens]MBD3663833.1 hypothetical protein [Sulfitobacter aestuariivivens]